MHPTAKWLLAVSDPITGCGNGLAVVMIAIQAGSDAHIVLLLMLDLLVVFEKARVQGSVLR